MIQSTTVKYEAMLKGKTLKMENKEGTIRGSEFDRFQCDCCFLISQYMNQIQHKQPGSDPVRKREQYLDSHSIVSHLPVAYDPSAQGDNASRNHANTTCNGGIQVPGLKCRVATAVHTHCPTAEVIRLVDVQLDVSIIRAVNKWCKGNGFKDHNPYWDEDGYFTVVDGDLLPLNRLENMMSGAFDAPPVSFRLEKGKYKFANGRHRLAKILIHNNCNPHYVLTASEYVVEKNPGPPKVDKGPSGKRTGKTDKVKPSDKGIGVPKTEQARSSRGDKFAGEKVKKDLNVYTRSKWYTTAVEKGFKNKPALDKFNDHVKSVSGEIDASAAPVCENCGSCDLILCDCFITGKGVDIIDNAVVIPDCVASITWRFTWVERIRRMFTMPKFDSKLAINHNVGGFSNADIGDALVWPEMLSYIRLNQNVSYVISGKYDRLAKLTHSKKLANKFLDEHKIALKDRVSAAFVNRVHSTVQKAADLQDDDMLLAQNNEQHNLNCLGPLQHVWKHSGKYSILAATVYPVIRSRPGIAVMGLVRLIVRTFITNIGKTLVFGSGSLLFWLLKSFVQSPLVWALGTLSGTGYLFWTAIRPLLCKIAGITPRIH